MATGDKVPYIYKASLPDGKYVEGTIKAISKEAVANEFSKRGVILLEINEQSILTRDIDFKRKVKQKEVAQFMRQLATMTDAGIAITRCLDVLKDQAASPGMKDTISKIRVDVDAGSTLGNALEKHPDVFKPVSIAMVRAGEAGGFLTPDVLVSIANNLEAEIKLRTKIKSAMTYPGIVMTIIGIIVTGLILFVVPQFAKTFTELNSELPLATSILLRISEYFRSWWALTFVIFVVALVLVIRKYRTHPKFRKYFEPVKYRIPVFGKLSQKIIIARFSRNFAALLQAGLPILQILDVVSNTAGSYQISEALKEVRRRVSIGEYMSPQLRDFRIFPALLVEMLAVGEEAGEMPAMLEKIAEAYEYEAEAMTEALSSLIEPLLLAVMGVIVGGILVALYLPMFSVYGAIADAGG